MRTFKPNNIKCIDIILTKKIGFETVLETFNMIKRERKKFLLQSNVDKKCHKENVLFSYESFL